jgi:hypothetical protein
MFFVRGKNEHVLCAKCKGYNGPYAKCRCQLKHPKKFCCGCDPKEKFSFFYIYSLDVDWITAEHRLEEEKRTQKIDIIADVNIEDNPFMHCVVSIYDKYYNLSKAEAIEIHGPYFHQFHITKHGSPRDICYGDDLAYAEDFK